MTEARSQAALGRPGAEGPYLDKGASNLPADGLRRETKDCKARLKVYAHPGPGGSPGHRWAVRAYLQELSDKDLAAIWLRPAGPSQ